MRKAGQEAGKGQIRFANANFSLGFAFGDGCAQGWQTSKPGKANVFALGQGQAYGKTHGFEAF